MSDLTPQEIEDAVMPLYDEREELELELAEINDVPGYLSAYQQRRSDEIEERIDEIDVELATYPPY
jgi:hypothetical protein